MTPRLTPRFFFKCCRAFATLLCIFFPLANGSAQPGLPGSPDWIQGEAGIDFNLNNEANKKDGPWLRVWPNGNLYYVGGFEDGMPKGEFTFYFESGEVMSEVIHTSGGKRAFTKLFRPNGSKQGEGLYIASSELDENNEPIRKKQGEWKYFDQADNVRLVEHYANDILEGATQSFGQQGQLLEEGEYKQGNRHGIWKTWDETSILLSEIGYDNGHFHGTCRVSHSSGRPRSIGLYKHGQEHGFWKTFSEDGTLENTRQFEEGELIKEIHENGEVLLTFSDGRPREEFTVVNQKKEGPFREWYDAGEWSLEEDTDPVSGEKFFRRVLAGELVRREGEYVNGMLEGEVYHYDKSHRLQLIEIYEQGKLISSEAK